MTNTQVFDTYEVGIYPYETYEAVPTNLTLLPSLPDGFTSAFWDQLDGSGEPVATGGTLITRNHLNYHKNPTNQVLNIADVLSNGFIQYNNITNYTVGSTKYAITTQIPTTVRPASSIIYIERVNTISLLNNSTLIFNISSLRTTYKTPYEFNFFYIQLNDTTQNCYGYIMYPNKIFIQPTLLTKANNRWQLTTSVKMLTSSTVHIQSNTIESDALTLHRNRLESLPLTVNLPTNLNNYNLNFNIFACRGKSNLPVVNFGTSPIYHSETYLDGTGDIYNINPDSTFISFSASYKGTAVMQSLAQLPKTLTYTNSSQFFNPTFILNYDKNNNKQTFQLLQAPLNANYELSNAENCVLSAAVNLNDGYFNFYNYYVQAVPSSQISFPNNSYIGFDYIADCYNLKSTNAPASSSLYNQEIIIGSSTNVGLLSTVTVDQIGTNNITWDTVYPPYCYSYKIKLTDSSGNYLDSNSLNFYLKLLTKTKNLNSVSLSAIVASDFNAITMPIANTDNIKYSIIATSLNSIDSFLNKITCYYGDQEQPYDIKNSPLVPVANNPILKILYNNTDFVGVKFTIKATLETAAGELDTFEPLNLSFNIPDQINGNSLFINILNEVSNNIVLDSSFNVSASSWPSRDLKNSKIKWFYDRTDLPLTFNYVDSNGDYISPVDGETTFNDQTWKVSLSGYGPNKVLISLSSQKYNEIASLYTHPSLYNLLDEHKIVVGPITKLDNLNLTRTIQLTAAIPYGKNTYPIPKNIPIFWTWEYDDILDPMIQPISVNEILTNNKDYAYATNVKSCFLSAIKVNVTPNYSKVSPLVHKVKLIANIDVVQPPITGSYTFEVDDFPDPSIFNTDFSTYYTGYVLSALKIANTSYDDQKVITRSNGDYSLNLTFSANNNQTYGGDTYWIFNSISALPTTNFYSTTANKNINNFYVELYNPQEPLSGITLNNLEVTAISVGLNLEKGLATGWTSAHNVSAVTNIFILSSVDFNQELKFIIYPEYAWLPPDREYLTYLNSISGTDGYYTNSYTPSAYLNKKSNSQTFWVSANKKCFDNYIYQNQQNYTIIPATSSHELIDIPYNSGDISIIKGIPISLAGYNDSFYPENLKLSYLIDINTGNLETKKYNITAQTINGKPSNDNVNNNFFLSPRIIPYSDIELNFTVFCNGNSATNNLILDEGGLISIYQTISTLPTNSPSIIINGTITYYLSGPYWEVSKTINAVDGNYDIFNIKIGDPSIPLYSGELGVDRFHIYAKPNLVQQIPPTTFTKYLNTSKYPSNPDLWNKLNI
jgi:hypothetical protein